MPSRLGKHAQDNSVWDAVHNDAHNPLRKVQNILVELDSNNPPSVLEGTSFYYAGSDSYTSGNITTNNLVYPGNTSLTYTLDEVIFEQNDRTFSWASGNFPAKSNSTTYYLYCDGAENIDSSSRGKGTYGVSTNAPTYDHEKGGWYSSDGFVLATFTTDGSGNVGDLEIYGNDAPDLSDGTIVQVKNGKFIEAASDMFSVYMNGNQTLTTAGVRYTLQLDVENFDTNSTWDISTYQHTPVIAGKYLYNLTVTWQSITDQQYCEIGIFKNGSSTAEALVALRSGATAAVTINCQQLVDMNGTTDYIEFKARQQEASKTILSTRNITYASGMLIR